MSISETLAATARDAPWLTAVALLILVASILLLLLLLQGLKADATARDFGGHVIRTVTRHARYLPSESKHAFHYPGLYLGVDLEALESGALNRGRFFRWQHPQQWALLSIRSSGYMHAHREGGKPGIRGRLVDELARHAIDTAQIGKIYTLSMPAYGSFEGINPLVVHFVYSRQGELKVVVLEVHNTFEERHIYVLQRGVKEDEEVAARCAKRSVLALPTLRPPSFDHQWTLPRAFHVSPFNDRSGFYRVSVSNPLPGLAKATGLPASSHINIRILLLTGEETPRKKLMATLEGQGVPLKTTSLLRALSALPVSLLLTTPRILYEAARLHYRKGLDVYPRPEPYVGFKDGEANPVVAEAAVGSVYWQTASSADGYARSIVEQLLERRCKELGLSVLLRPEDTALESKTIGSGEKTLIIHYASPLLFSDLLMAPSAELAIMMSDGKWRVFDAKMFAELWATHTSSTTDKSQAAQKCAELRRDYVAWLHSFTPDVPLPDRPASHPLESIADSALVSHLWWRFFNERLGYYIFRLTRARFVKGTEPWAVLGRAGRFEVAEQLKQLGQGIGSVRRAT